MDQKCPGLIKTDKNYDFLNIINHIHEKNFDKMDKEILESRLLNSVINTESARNILYREDVINPNGFIENI